MDDSLDGDDAPASAWREDPFLDGVDDFSDEDQRVDHRGWRVDELAPPADDDGKGFIPGPASLETAGELEDDEAIGDGDDDDAEDELKALADLDATVRRSADVPRRAIPITVGAVRAAVQPLANALDLGARACLANGEAIREPAPISFRELATTGRGMVEAWAVAVQLAYVDCGVLEEEIDSDGGGGAFGLCSAVAAAPAFGQCDEAAPEDESFDGDETEGDGDGDDGPVASLAGHGEPGLPAAVADASHLSLSSAAHRMRFVQLPDAFTELYARLRDASGAGADDADPAICLLTGRVLNAGAKRAPGQPGNCTVHARRVNGDGVGVFFLVLKCAVLLVRGPHASYAPSIYVDDHGEEDVGLRRGAPLRLHRGRLEALEKLYASHGVAREVARLRAKSNRVIRDNYY
mmetsp:Transcript_18701/g.55434  ORF Transcript_18701/g.55434 Transcript_18701/m.55434 type:complete len:407 (-) Transcript_18701:12-1232(-)